MPNNSGEISAPTEPPFPERGFKAERFRPLDEIKAMNAKKQTQGAGVLVED